VKIVASVWSAASSAQERKWMAKLSLTKIIALAAVCVWRPARRMPLRCWKEKMKPDLHQIILNYKITRNMSETNLKSQTVLRLVIGIWNLFVIWLLGFVI